MKRALAALVTALAAATLISPAAASAATLKHGCHLLPPTKPDTASASCTNATGHMLTANLYVDCRPNWPDQHVQKSIWPNQTVVLSAHCGGWSHPVGATAYMN